MIKSFSHKGLRTFFETDDPHGIYPNHVEKVRLILSLLNKAKSISDMNLPGYRLHLLKGNYKGFWAVKIDGKYRIIFKFIDRNAYAVAYINYHE